MAAYSFIYLSTILLNIDKILAEKISLKKSPRLCPVECLCGMGTSQYLSGYFSTVDCRNKKLMLLPLQFPPETVVLLVRGNALSDFNPFDQFTSLAALRDLDLSYNRLRTVNLEPLNQTRLSYLNLKSNNLESLSTSLNLWSVPHLEILQLTDNKINSIENGCFDRVTSLQRLSLAGNRLTRLTRDSFSGLRSLLELRIDRCLLEEIEEGTFKSLTLLETLTLTYNKISQLSFGSFAGLERLQHLHLDGNRFSSVPGDSFTVFQGLKSINFNYNPVRKLKRQSFSSFSVQEINLEHMSQLLLVDREAFYNLRTLNVINMANNPILSFVDREAITFCPKLTTILINNSSLFACPNSFLNVSSVLKTLDLRFNPLRCDCNSKWIIDYINSSSTKPEILLTNPKRFCNSQDAAADISLRGVTEKSDSDTRNKSTLGYDLLFAQNEISADDNVTNANVSTVIADPGSCAPVIIKLFNDTVYQELGKSLTIDCRAVANPEPKIYWITSSGKVIKDSPNDSRLKLDKRGSLSIQYVKQADAGRYTCIAFNTRGSSEMTTVLRLYSSEARVICQSIGSTFISITWAGTDSTLATVQYAVLYREGGANSSGLAQTTPYTTASTEYSIIELRRYMRNFWIGNLKPRTLYEICMTYEDSYRAFVRIDCSHVQTGDPELKTEVDGIYRIASRVVLGAILLTCAAPVFICVMVVIIRRHHRRKFYSEPLDRRFSSVIRDEGPGTGGPEDSRGVTVRPLSHIPLDEFYQLPSTSLANSRTSLIT